MNSSERNLNGFGRTEKKLFDKAFPPEEINAFINSGGDNPVEIFSALRQFDFPDTKPGTQDIVLAYFSESRFAPQINMHDGENGQVMIYRENIIPLLRASQDVFFQIFDLLTDETKSVINKVLSTQSNPEKDWQK